MREPQTREIFLGISWVSLALRGMAAMAFGGATLIMPEMTVWVLMALFGGYALADGMVNWVMAARAGRYSQHRGAMIVHGIASIGAAVATWLWPDLTAFTMLYIIAGWAVAKGAAEIMMAVRLRKLIHDEWLLGLSGTASVVLGAVLILFPNAGVLAVLLWIGAYALVFGALLIAAALRIRSWHRHQMFGGQRQSRRHAMA